MTRCLLFLVLFCVLAAGIVSAESCGGNAAGKSFAVHGRYAIYVEGDAIWIVGTKRLLSAVSDDLDHMLEAKGWEDYVVYGDFIVCPMTRFQRGHMQAVRILSYKNLRFEKRR